MITVTEQELAARAVAPRVTEADVAAAIASEHYFTAAQGIAGEARDIWVADSAPEPTRLLTFCVLVLKNGFTVTGESACASPENFDPEIGKRLARDMAVRKIWPMLGFMLREQLHLRRSVA